MPNQDGTRGAHHSALPAEGWRACFWREISHRSQEVFLEDIAMWTVYEDGHVAGMVAGPDGTLVDAETLDNFLGYATKGGNLARYREEANRRAEELDKRGRMEAING